MHAWSAPTVPTVDLPLPPLQLFDTSTRSVRPTDPGDVATMYICGITPYDATHMGHAATYVTFDLVNRYWRAGGHQVQYVQNVTDIDDPLLERAERDGVDWRELAEQQTDLFRSDMTALRVLPPAFYIGAVEAMGEVSAAVQSLLDTGAAYRVADDSFADVYFDVSTTEQFGYESGYDEATMLALSAERGGDPERTGKRHALDPLLWRMARPGEPSWPSSLGDGRPGWHIECAVIAVNRIGGTIDLQGGGADLIFPHHECSAAHVEALSGDHPFARHYVHTGMMTLDGEKMSKSLGNLEFVSRLTARGVDPMAIRATLLDEHYRQDRPWSEEALARGIARLEAWRGAARRTEGAAPDALIAEFVDAIADDLNTPAALAVLDRWAADGTWTGAAMASAADALLGIALTSSTVAGRKVSVRSAPSA